MPLQAYFKVTAVSSGQYERTLLIAEDDSEIVYSEGCSSVQDSGTNFHTAVVELIAHNRARIHDTIQTELEEEHVQLDREARPLS